MQKLSVAVLAIAGVAQANYLSGEVRSQEWFHYGKFVAKMQNPGKMGTVQSFFTYTAQDWPHGWNEIDVEIVPSVTENPFSMNIIWKDGAQDHNYATGFHPGTDWFTYTVEWTPDYVSWYVNDKLVRKSEGTEDVHFLDMPTQLMMNFWTPCWSPWNDYFDDAEMPWYAKYDYVEVHDYNVDTKEFKLRWKDDFNTFDSKKWYASDNWGFENNSSLFMSSQVYVEDGSLVLKMDYNDGHPRTFPEHHQVVHSEKPHHEDPHHVEEHHAAKAPHQTQEHHDTKAVHQEAPHQEAPHHEAVAAHHEAPHQVAPHHEAPHQVAPHHEAVYHEAPHHEAVHQVAPHHEAADLHRYDAPLTPHHEYREETGYPQHYSEHDFEAVSHAYHDTHYGYPEHERAEGRHFKHGYSEGDHQAHHYETMKYSAPAYPEHHEERQYYHQYQAPVTEHREVGEHQPHAAHEDYKTFHDRQDAYIHDEYRSHPRYYTDAKEQYYH